MGLSLSISGAKLNFNLSECEITGYDFIYRAQGSKYAKNNDERYLKIKGNLIGITKNNPDALPQLTEWSKTEFEGAGYYHNVKAATIHAGKEVRAIIFPEAFVKEYEIKADPKTGHGHFNLLLMQKPDKRTDIVISPFN